MARTIQEIKSEMAGEFMRNESAAALYGFEPGAAFADRFGAASIENILFYVWAVCAWAVEQLIDRHKAEVTAELDEQVAHRPKWYRDRVLAFMANMELMPDSDRYDTTGMTESDMAARRVVKHAVAVENRNSSALTIKVAGESGGNDSVALDKFRNVADEYGYKSGDIAALNAAIILYKDKKYEEALTYLKKYSTTETIIGAGAKSLEGDCYVNLKQYPQALDAFKAAVKVSDNNPYYTPVFLMKQATVLREMKDYKAEAAIYEQILKDYPKAPAALNVDIEKYLQRAKASEAK